jgi:acetoin utilization deacetylase AcuC-like enzyme
MVGQHREWPGAHGLYLDIEIHHGDGVEEAFYATDRVVSAPQHPLSLHIVLAILHLLKHHARVLYLDIDIHHGDRPLPKSPGPRTFRLFS